MSVVDNRKKAICAFFVVMKDPKLNKELVKHNFTPYNYKLQHIIGFAILTHKFKQDEFVKNFPDIHLYQPTTILQKGKCVYLIHRQHMLGEPIKYSGKIDRIVWKEFKDADKEILEGLLNAGGNHTLIELNKKFQLKFYVCGVCQRLMRSIQDGAQRFVVRSSKYLSFTNNLDEIKNLLERRRQKKKPLQMPKKNKAVSGNRKNKRNQKRDQRKLETWHYLNEFRNDVNEIVSERKINKEYDQLYNEWLMHAASFGIKRNVFIADDERISSSWRKVRKAKPEEMKSAADIEREFYAKSIIKR